MHDIARLAQVSIGTVDRALHGRKEINHQTRARERAVAIAPRLAQAHYHLGVAYRDAGRADDAQREFALARALGGQ